MSYINAVTSHFSSYFTTSQVVQRTIHTNTAYWAHSTMIVNVSAQYLQRFDAPKRSAHRQDVGERNKYWAADTCYDVHPLALWILCAAFHHSGGSSRSLHYYRQNNAIASTGAYWTGTPIDRAIRQAERCMAHTREGCGNFRDADPMVNALAELDGWVPTEKQLIALRRGGWSWGFDFARFCPDLPPHDGWSGKAGGML